MAEACDFFYFWHFIFASDGEMGGAMLLFLRNPLGVAVQNKTPMGNSGGNKIRKGPGAW